MHLFVISIFTVIAFSAVAKTSSKLEKRHPAQTPANHYDFKQYPLKEISEQQFSKWLQEVHLEEKRAPAQVSADGLKFIIEKDVEFKKFHDDYLALDLVANPLLFESFIKDYVQKIGAGTIHSASVIYTVAQFQLLTALRSFTFRIKPYLAQSNMTDSLMVTLGYSLFQNRKVLSNNKQAEGLAKYVTEPFEEKDLNSLISTADQFQDFLYHDLYAALQVSSNMLADLAQKSPDTKLSPVAIYDFQLLYSNGTFVDGLDRYKAVGKSEIFALVSTFESMMSQIAFGVCYDFSDADKIAKEIGLHFGFSDGSLAGTVQGLPASKRAAILAKYPNFLQMKPSSQDALTRSYTHLQRSVDFAEMAWSSLKNRRSPAGYFLYSNIVDGYQDRADSSIAIWKKIVYADDQPVTVTSALTGDPTRMSIKNLFSEEHGVKNLQDFLPEAPFEKEDRMLTKTIATAKGPKSVDYRNFNRGAPRNWKTDVYRKFFPDVKTNEDVPKVAGNLSGAWGTSALYLPFSLVIQ